MLPTFPSIPSHVNASSPWAYEGDGLGSTQESVAAFRPLNLATPPTYPSTAKSTVRDNPFANEEDDDDDKQMEADLQKLGGQMIRSILDF
jgi:hypothetical protein